MWLSRISTAGYLAIIVIGLIATVLAFATDGAKAGIPVLIIFISIMSAWHAAASWILGIKRHIVGHIGQPQQQLVFVSKNIGSSRKADYLRVFEKIAAERSVKRLGLPEYQSLNSIQKQNVTVEPVAWETFEVEDDRVINLPQNAIYFLNMADKPIVVSVTAEQRHFHDFEHEDATSTHKAALLHLCAANLDDANQAMTWLNDQLASSSIYKGQLLQVASPQDGSTGQTIRITKLPVQDLSKIVLPKELLDLTTRLVRTRIQYGDQLSHHGHLPSLGILLHGAPGTGKTLLIRYLISMSQGHTVIVPTDMAVETLREVFRLSQYLQPAIVVLEDVDLLAQRRQDSQNHDGLQELMNQLDGLSPISNIVTLMSTNCPEVLESALAARPGRVSQAIELPPPDAAARRRLFDLFLGATEVDDLDFDDWCRRTEGASPAFLQELCKRVILLAVDRMNNDATQPRQPPKVVVQHQDFEQAIHELLIFGGQLTASALGFPQPIVE